MFSFEQYNPVKIVFGQDVLSQSLPDLVKMYQRVFVCSGMGSAESSGLLAKVRSLLGHSIVGEFKGIEANPDIDTLAKAALSCRAVNADFILAIGGGSVVDGVKLIASQAKLNLADPWRIVTSHGRLVKDPLPYGAILTLSATGSESNPWSVISRRASGEKLSFGHPSLYPVFSVIDSSLMMGLPRRQVINGVVDPFVHVMEQYLTYPVNAKLQERQSEAILSVLLEDGPRALADLTDVESRQNIIWAATSALNGFIGLGVPQDWSTHMIGHELTALYGLDHAQSLAVVLPGVMKIEREAKRPMINQYGRRVLGLKGEDVSLQAIEMTRDFFHSLGAKTKLCEYGIAKADLQDLSERLNKIYPLGLGEKKSIKGEKFRQILDAVYE